MRTSTNSPTVAGLARQDAPINIRGVGGPPGDQGLLHEGAHGPVDLCLAELRGDALLEFHRLLVARCFDFRRDLSVHLRGARAAFLRR